jgi:hypothetical protein
MAINPNDGFKASITRIFHTNGAVVGAGFLVSGHYVLTCAHVVTAALGIPGNITEAPTGSIDLDFPLVAAGQKIKAQVVFWRPVNPSAVGEDIAGLRLEGELPNGVQPVRLVTADELWAHPIRIFGFPAGHTNGVWASGVLRDKLANDWVQIEDNKVTGLRVERGFSGTPVWDETLVGVVGMAVAADTQRQEGKVAFIIPTKVLIQAWSILGQSVDVGGKQPLEQGIGSNPVLCSPDKPVPEVKILKEEGINNRQLEPNTSEKTIKKMSSQDRIPRIFICYAHKDNESTDPSQRWLDRLLEQLEPLNLQEQAEIWSDKKLEIGDEWHEEIQDTLQQVKAAVLLVSPSFLASKYIRNSEVPFLWKQAKEQGVKILPIILRSCLFNETKFKYPDPKNGPEEISLSTLQVANSPTKPLNSMAEHEQDKVLLSVAQRLLNIVNTSVLEQSQIELVEDNEERQLFSSREVPSKARYEFYKKLLIAKQEELAKVESQLDEALSQDEELRLNRKAERLLNEIQQLKAKLS